MKLEVALQKIRGTNKSIRRKAWEKGLRKIYIKQENPFIKEELELYVMGKNSIPYYTIWEPRRGEELETDWVICR